MSLHIDITGHGPPLVLLHGWAMHSGVFSALSERLRHAHTLYLVDLPGHGCNRDSTLPLALEPVTQTLLNTLPPAIWLGWSLGGLFALHAAAHPNVHGLIMLAATPRFVRSEDWPHGMPADTFGPFASALETDYHATLDRFIALETFGSDHAREELRTLRHLLFARGEPAPRALSDGLSLLEHTDLRPRLAALSIPSLWLSGRRDRLVHPLAVEAAAALTPHAQTAVIDHAGHAPMLTHADTLAAHILRFTVHLPAQ